MGVPVRQPVSDPVAMVRRLNARAYHSKKQRFCRRLFQAHKHRDSM